MKTRNNDNEHWTKLHEITSNCWTETNSEYLSSLEDSKSGISGRLWAQITLNRIRPKLIKFKESYQVETINVTLMEQSLLKHIKMF
jgi:hypothetical protein